MSEIKSILLHVDASARCEACLKAARVLAKQHDVDILALYGAVRRPCGFPLRTR
jgi:hypothetical protein